jgi:hypothetical protein
LFIRNGYGATKEEAVDEVIRISIGNYAIGFGALALVNACLAQIKNNMCQEEERGFGGLFWFIVSLFLGPFATLFILLFKKPIGR